MTKRPRGRPPLRHRWLEGQYLHEDSATPYSEGREEHARSQHEVRKNVRRERYSSNISDVRDKQREYLRKRRRERGAVPRKSGAANCTLDEMPVGAFNEPSV